MKPVTGRTTYKKNLSQLTLVAYTKHTIQTQEEVRVQQPAYVDPGIDKESQDKCEGSQDD